MLLPHDTRQSQFVNVSACPHPFESRRVDYAVPFGLTIAEIIEHVQPDPVLREHGNVFIAGELIERYWWNRVRPKPGTVISVRLLPSGGGGWRLAAMIGIAVIAIGIVAIGAPFLVPFVGAGLAPVVAGLGAAAFTFGATMLLNRLIPPPVPEISKNIGKDSPTYAITGQRNTSQPWGKVPFLLGRFRLTPPYAAQPYREVTGGQVYWRALFCLSHGPIQIESMSIGSTALSNFEGVETEFRRGYWEFADRGHFSAAGGGYPSPDVSFGDTWTVTTGGVIDGVRYSPGDTITYNGLGPYYSSASWDLNQNLPLSIFPSDVYEDGLQIAVHYMQPEVRTSKNNADQLYVELVFERGLVHIENVPAGKRSENGAAVRIEQAPEGSGAWSLVTEQSIYDSRTVPIYWGWKWDTSAYSASNATKSFDVRVTRLTPDADEDRNFGNFTWFSLKTFTLQNPVPVSSIAYIAMRIQASGQLSGTLDEFNVVASSICRDWNAASGQWIWRATSQPAAHFRHVLQHPSRAGVHPIDDKIDLERLQHWDSITRPAGREFNAVIDNKTSLYDVLTKICRVGRAIPFLRDLILSVAIDEPKTVAVRMFTPRNSWDYSGKLVHSRIPHAYRIGFVNRDRDFTTDERVVYDDGYNADNATLIDRVEWVGITSSDQAWREGRYHLAQQRLGTETFTISTDFEYLACERGDLVAFQHDSIAVGLGSGRIKEVLQKSGTVVAVVVDNGFVMEGGKDYGFRARRVVNGSMQTNLYKVGTVIGSHDVLTLADPVIPANAPEVGDLISFGEYQRETLRVIVRDIEPKENLTAVLTLVPEAAGVHVADIGPIPPYDPLVTQPRALPAPVILNIQSGSKVMLVTAGRALVPRVVFTIRPIDIEDVRTIVIFRPTGASGQWQLPTNQDETPTSIGITGPEPGGIYDFRLQRTHWRYLSSPSTQVNGYHMLGSDGPPDDLQNLSLAITSGQILLRWDLPKDLDVQFGGWIVFRHSPIMEGANWPDSTSIGRTVNGDQTHVWLPLKPGTYMGRVYDSDGVPSLGVASVSTKQASLLPFSPVMDMQEDPDFSGSKINCAVDANGIPGLSLLSTGDFDAVADVDALLDWDLKTESVVGSGRYYFEGGMDFTAIRRIRLTSHILCYAVNQYAMIDGDDNIDSMEDFDGTDSANVDASIWVQVTDDNPNVSPVWGNYMRIDSAEIEARAIGNIYCLLSSDSSETNIEVTELRLFADEVSTYGPPIARANGYSVGTAVGIQDIGSDGAAAGSATANAVGAAGLAGSASASSISTSLVFGTGLSRIVGTATGAGTSTVSGVRLTSSVGSSTASSTASSIGTARYSGVGACSGVAAASGVGTTGGPVYISSGTGSNVSFGVNPTPSYPATGIVAGNLAVLQLYVKNDASGSLTPPGDWTSMGADGTGVSDRQSTYYKVLSGTESGTITVTTAGTAGRRAARIYVFSSSDSGTWSIEDYDTEASGAGATAVSDNNVTTGGENRLAVNLIGYSTRQTTGQESFVGTTGGTWTPNAFFDAGSNPSLSIETANMASAGTIGGGSDTSITSSLSIVTGFAIYKSLLSYNRVYYYAEALTRSTTNTTDYSVTKTSVTFTPNSGKTYAIFGNVLVDGSAQTGQIKARLINTTDSSILWENVSVPYDNVPSSEIRSFGGVGIFTASSTPTSQTFAIQIASSVSSQTIGASEANIFAIELISGYDQWAYSSGETISTSTAWVSKASLSWNSAVSGDYFIFASAEYTGSDATGAASKVRVNINGSYVNVHDYAISAADDVWDNYVGGGFISSGVGTQTAALEHGGVNTSSCSIRHGAIVALRLDRFANAYGDEDRTTHSSTSATWANAAVTASVTPNAVAHAIIGIGQTQTNEYYWATAAGQRAQSGSTNIGSIFTQNRGWNPSSWWTWFSLRKITETAVSKTYKTQYARTIGTATATVADNVIVSLQLTTGDNDVVIDGITRTLNWSDEFDGSSLDASKWVIIENDVTAYMGTTQFAADLPYVSGSVLHLPVSLRSGSWWQSGVQTMNDVTRELKHWFDPSAGVYIEIRAKMPKGIASLTDSAMTGIWSAAWLMPARGQTGIVDYYYDYGGGNLGYWPTCGEIDLWETQWNANWLNHKLWSGVIQAKNTDPGWAVQIRRFVSSVGLDIPDFATDWHTFGFHFWFDGTTIQQRFRIDGVQVLSCNGGNFTTDPTNFDQWDQNSLVSQWPKLAIQAGSHGTGPQGSPFDRPFYLILNTYAGNEGPESQSSVDINPDNDGQELLIDWVRSYV